MRLKLKLVGASISLLPHVNKLYAMLYRITDHIDNRRPGDISGLCAQALWMLDAQEAILNEGRVLFGDPPCKNSRAAEQVRRILKAHAQPPSAPEG